VLEGQPDPPAYFAAMKRLNASGPPPGDQIARPRRMQPDEVSAAIESGTLVVDTRSAEVYSRGHVPGTINIPLDRSFLTWMGSLVPLDQDVVLIGSEPQLAQAVSDLSLIGIDRVIGHAGPDFLHAWEQSGRPLEQVTELTVESAVTQIASGVAIVDVRSTSEWMSGHIPGAVHVPLGTLRDRSSELPRDRPVIVYCQTGGRSSIAVSTLLAAGLRQAANLRGGLAAWSDAGNRVDADTVGA
jgi:hydroxyacylglutathione hydrolase